MLEDWFTRTSDRERIRQNPLAPTLERYVTFLATRGHVRRSVQRYVNAAEHFGRWLGRRPLSRGMVKRFVREHLPHCRCRPPAPRKSTTTHAALQHLLTVCGVARVRVHVPRRRGVIWDLLQRYREALVTERGLAIRTVERNVTAAQVMLRRHRVQNPRHLRAWTPELVVRHVIRAARGHRASSSKSMASTVRSFLKFLLQEGLIDQDLSAAVPTFAHWRLAALPDTLHEEEVKRLIAAADLRRPLGLRDQAIVLCFSELGLRLSEVTALRVDGVDCATRTLRVYRGKQQESVQVPMTRKLASALQAYLRHSRPACRTIDA